MSLEVKHLRTFYLDMDMVINTFEKLIEYGISVTKINGKVEWSSQLTIGKLIKLANVLLRWETSSRKRFINEVFKSKPNIPYSQEFKIFDSFPKYITFTLNYGKYFNSFDDIGLLFSSRSYFWRILTEKFLLKEIFSISDLRNSFNSSFGTYDDRLAAKARISESTEWVLDW